MYEKKTSVFLLFAIVGVSVQIYLLGLPSLLMFGQHLTCLKKCGFSSKNAAISVRKDGF